MLLAPRVAALWLVASTVVWGESGANGMAARRKPGDQVGPWMLRKHLGRGANADVWEAEGATGDPVALKVLKQLDARSEQYRRFRSEVAVLREVADMPGVLPLIDASLPDAPGLAQPAWLAMPIAELIGEALATSPLGEVVEAWAAIAATLSDLAARDIYHRDIKPANLYRHEGRWVVGDFGIAEFPDKEALTQPNRKLGPAWFMAPEMMNNPATAEPGPADVYALAKTAWVLAAGQNYPLPGEQRTDRAGARFSDVVVHERAYLLDRLLERATSNAPGQRPSMAEAAAELRAWLAAPPAAGPPAEAVDLDALAARVAATMGPGLRDERAREGYKRLAIAAFQQVYESFKELPQRFFTPVGLSGRVTLGHHDLLNSHLVRAQLTTGQTLMWQNYGQIPISAPPPQQASLWCAIGAQVFDNGTLDLAAALLMGKYHWPQDEVWSLSQSVTVGSAQEEQLVAEIIRGLNENVPRAIEAFLQLAADA